MQLLYIWSKSNCNYFAPPLAVMLQFYSEPPIYLSLSSLRTLDLKIRVAYQIVFRGRRVVKAEQRPVCL